MVDSILNEGHFSVYDIEEYRKKNDVKHAGVEAVRRLVAELDIDCDLEANGKIHDTAVKDHEKKLLNFSKLLTELELKHKILEGEELHQRLGSSYYCMGIWTEGSILLQPAKIERGMVENLPEQVELYENFPVLNWRKRSHSEGYQLYTPTGQVTCQKLIVTVNCFMASCGVKSNRTFPLTLTTSMTRPLTEKEEKSLGQPVPWGVFPAQSMGATVLLTKDRRILMSNTVEAWPAINMKFTDLKTRKAKHLEGLKRRLPSLGGDLFESTWSGTICISENNAHVFTEVEYGMYAAG